MQKPTSFMDPTVPVALSTVRYVRKYMVLYILAPDGSSFHFLVTIMGALAGQTTAPYSSTREESGFPLFVTTKRIMAKRMTE
jgi:hypothetical protein